MFTTETAVSLSDIPALGLLVATPQLSWWKSSHDSVPSASVQSQLAYFKEPLLSARGKCSTAFSTGLCQNYLHQACKLPAVTFLTFP